MFLIKVRIFSFYVRRTSDSTVSDDAEIEPRTVATTALAGSDAITTGLDLIHNYRKCM
jgi:hypothetical protein